MKTADEKWISVKERLPETDGRYITHRENGIVTMEHWFKDHSKHLWLKCYGVVNWMPLPSPPVGSPPNLDEKK